MRMNIAVKLGGVFTAITLTTVALVTVVVSFMVVNKLQDEAYRRVNNDLDVTMNAFVEYYSKDASRTARMLAESPALVADLAGHKPKAAAAMSSHLHGLAEDSLVTVFDVDGKAVYDDDPRGEASPRRHPAALSLALAGEDSQGVTVLGDALAIEATVPVYGTSAQVVGAVRVARKLDNKFVDQLKNITGLEVGIAEGEDVGIGDNSLHAHWLAQTILNENHGRLTSGVPVDLIPELRETHKPLRRAVEINHVTYMAALAPLWGPYGEFVGMICVGESIAPLHQAVRDTVLAIVAVALVVAVLGAIAVKFLALTITDPIRQLVSQSACIAKGQLDKRVQLKTGDELEQLANSFNLMCESLIEMQFRDQNANPLTKLPGNLMIEAETNRRLQAGDGVAVLYIDLDHFKAFNDKYGFEQGDRALQLTADILKSVCGENAPHNPTFVGHIGGDDFIVITKPQDAEETCMVLCAEFDRRIKELYTAEDRERGWIVSVDRQGNRQTFPFCSISIALVDNDARPIADFLELSSIAAEVKKYAKSLPGSSFARDRRADKETAFLTDW